MKQAVLITAYHQIDLLRKIIAFFDEDFDIYIHIDKKCDEDYSDIGNDHVFVYSKYRIFWGSEYHLFAIMHLVQESYKRGPYSYYHLITGNDFPIKPLAEFKSFFSEENKTNYLEYHPLPRGSWPNEGGIGRVRYFWFGNQITDIRQHHKLTDFLLKIQRKIGVMRRFVKKYPHLYGGGTYWSLKEDSIRVLMQNKDLGLMRFTHCAEEVFVHTLLINEVEQKYIINNSLRFMNWEGCNASPDFLTEKDFESICKSDAFWIRKVDIRYSMVLLNNIQEIVDADK